MRLQLQLGNCFSITIVAVARSATGAMQAPYVTGAVVHGLQGGGGAGMPPREPGGEANYSSSSQHCSC